MGQMQPQLGIWKRFIRSLLGVLSPSLSLFLSPSLSTQFGGKLVSFGNTHGAATPRSVHISQVVTEHTLLQRSNTLEESLSRQQFGEFCEQKVQECSNAQNRNIWNFLKVHKGLCIKIHVTVRLSFFVCLFVCFCFCLFFFAGG